MELEPMELEPTEGLELEPPDALELQLTTGARRQGSAARLPACLPRPKPQQALLPKPLLESLSWRGPKGFAQHFSASGPCAMESQAAPSVEKTPSILPPMA